MDSLTAAWEWLRANPLVGVGAVGALVAIVWYLRRPDPVLKEGSKEFDRLAQKNRGRYDDLRPLK